MTGDLQERFSYNARLSRAVSFGLVVLLAFCSGIVFDGFAGRLSPGWVLGYLPWASAAAALLGILSETQVHNLSAFSGERFAFRFSGAVVAVLLLKLGYFLYYGGDAFLAELTGYRSNLWGTFFSGGFNALLLLSFFAWLFAIRMAGDLIDTSLDREFLEEGFRPSMTTDRSEVGNQMAGAVLFYGALLIVIAVLTRADMDLLWRGAPPIERGAGGVIAYFCVALVLFSLNRFAILRARWGWERTPISAGLARAWLVYSSAAIAVVLLAALMLPTGYSLGLFESAALVFQLIYALVAYIVYLLILPLLLLLSTLNLEDSNELHEPPGDLLPPTPVPGGALNPDDPAAWLEALRSLVFWAVFIGVAVYAVVQFARQNAALWERLKTVAVLRHLLEALRAIQDWFSRAARGTEKVVLGSLARLRAARGPGLPGGLGGLVGFHRLPPREQVLFLYRALLRRAGEARIARGVSQTPGEYAAELERNFPESGLEIRAMTAAFEAARYTRREIVREDVAVMRADWERLRKALRGERARRSM